MSELEDQLAGLLDEARGLLDAIREGEADNRARRRAHGLRETLGVALILSERLARDAGNDEMVQLERSGHGGRVSFSVDLDSDEWDLN
jgi:uncharacterized membrane protein YccC